jgi:hypothetical protein
MLSLRQPQHTRRTTWRDEDEMATRIAAYTANVQMPRRDERHTHLRASRPRTTAMTADERVTSTYVSSGARHHLTRFGSHLDVMVS